MPNRLKELREERRLSMRELADEIGVTAPSISNWERGKNDMSLAMSNQLAAYFGVSRDYLLGLTDENEYDEIHAHRRADGPVDTSDVNLAKSLEMIISQYEAGYLSQDEFNQAKK